MLKNNQANVFKDFFFNFVDMKKKTLTKIVTQFIDNDAIN